MLTISVAEAKEHLADYLRKAIAGEDVQILADGKAVALTVTFPKQPHISPRDALRNMQNRGTLTENKANDFCAELAEQHRSWKR